MIGTQLLRAYMHGFFIDVRLYNKVAFESLISRSRLIDRCQAKESANPFAYEEYKRNKIQTMIEEGTMSRLQLSKAKKNVCVRSMVSTAASCRYCSQLPKINKILAQRLIGEAGKGDAVCSLSMVECIHLDSMNLSFSIWFSICCTKTFALTP